MKTCIRLLLVLIMSGCSNSQLAQKNGPKAPASAPVVDNAEIVVIPNPYVDDVTLANRAAEEAKQELIKRGYKLVETEAEAKIVAVPTVETGFITVVRSQSDRPIDLFSDNSNFMQVDRTQTVVNSLGSIGGVSFSGPGTSSRKGNDELVIEAFPKEAWDHALIVNELQLQPNWKIRLPLPADLKPIEGEKIAHTAPKAGTDFQLPH
jgi:hypothetical protein